MKSPQQWANEINGEGVDEQARSLAVGLFNAMQQIPEQEFDGDSWMRVATEFLTESLGQKMDPATVAAIQGDALTEVDDEADDNGVALQLRRVITPDEMAVARAIPGWAEMTANGIARVAHAHLVAQSIAWRNGQPAAPAPDEEVEEEEPLPDLLETMHSYPGGIDALCKTTDMSRKMLYRIANAHHASLPKKQLAAIAKAFKGPVEWWQDAWTAIKRATPAP